MVGQKLLSFPVHLLCVEVAAEGGKHKHRRRISRDLLKTHAAWDKFWDKHQVIMQLQHTSLPDLGHLLCNSLSFCPCDSS